MTEERDRAVQPFDQVLRQMNGGALINELTDEMTAVLEAVKNTGKSGSVSLNLKFTPEGSMNEQVTVTPSIKGNKPERARPLSIFFLNDDHGLQRDDPHQAGLPGLHVAETKHRSTSHD